MSSNTTTATTTTTTTTTNPSSSTSTSTTTNSNGNNNNNNNNNTLLSRKLNIIQEKQVESFKSQVNIRDDDVAILFLELSHWDVEEAINAWLEEQNGSKKFSNGNNSRQRRISKGPVSLVGIKDYQSVVHQITHNSIAMKKIQQAFDQGVQQVSLLLDQWGIPLNAMQFKVINSLQAYVKSVPSEAEVKNFTEQCSLQIGMADALEHYLKAECEENTSVQVKYEDIMNILTGVVRRSVDQKQAIPPSLLYLVSKHTIEMEEKDGKNFVETELWNNTLKPRIKQTLQCEEIISDPVGWKWMENYILPSPIWMLKRDDLLHMNEELLSIAKEQLQVKPAALKRKREEKKEESKEEIGSNDTSTTVDMERYEEEWMKLYHTVENQTNMFEQAIKLQHTLPKQLQEACKNTATLSRLALHSKVNVPKEIFVDNNKPLLSRALDNKDYRCGLIVIRDLNGRDAIDWKYTHSQDKGNTYLHQIFKKWGVNADIIKQYVTNIPKNAVISQLNTKNQAGDSALMYAITEGDISALLWLLEYCKEGIDWTYHSGERTYFHAIADCCHRNSKGLKQLFHAVNEKDLSVQFQQIDAEGKTPLMVLLDRNVSEDVIVRLLQRTKAINWKAIESKIQRSHLHQICATCLKNEENALQIIDLLPDEAYKLQINLQDKRKQTPFMAAFPATPSKTVLVTLFNKKKDLIDWSLKDQTDMTYLHFVMRYYYSDVDTCKALCEIIPKQALSSQFNSKDKKGKTPQAYAEEFGASTELLEWLKTLP